MIKYLLASILFVSPQFSVAQNSLEDILTEEAEVEEVKEVKAAPVKASLVQTLITLNGTKNPQHNVVYRLIETQDWKKAVIQFPKVFESSAFYTSTNGLATLSLLQYQAGLKITALETLFKISQPSQIHPFLKTYIGKMITTDDTAWMMAQVKWTKAWDVVFTTSAQVWTEYFNLENKSIEDLTALAAAQPAGSKSQSLVNWHLAIKYSLANQFEKSAKILSQLKKNSNSYISQDLIQLTAARILFQNAYFETAIKEYQKVSKGSEHWPQAQEEIAWSYIRKGESHNAIAMGQSLIHPGLASQVSAESFLIMSLAQLKICDYPGVITTLSQYPKRFKSKNMALKQLIDSTEDKNLENYLKAATDAKNGRVRFAAAKAKEFDVLPAVLDQDRKLAGLILKQSALEKEADVAETLYAQSLALTGLQGHFDILKKTTLARAQAAKTESVSRVKMLAQAEVEGIKTILDKLHIVEAEVIQQVDIADQIAKKSKDDGLEKIGTTGSKNKDAIVFPLEKEVWFDEISTYKVDVKKACAAKEKKVETL